MGHLATAQGVYAELAKRLDRNPIGAPPTKELYEILKILYNEDEAQMAAQFPMRPVPLEKLRVLLNWEDKKLQRTLESMADKGLVMDYQREEKTFYVLVPTVVGFFEHSFMKLHNPDLPLKELAGLMHDYLVEGDFAQEVFGSETQRARTLVAESAIAEFGPEVLPYEKASEIIREAGLGALTTCFCRHVARHRGTACTAPVTDVCTVLGRAAGFFVRRGFARRAEAAELMDVLDMTEELGLCHIGDNVQEGVAFICHCCKCCCFLLGGNNRFGLHHSVAPSNYASVVDEEKCTGCRTCLKRCPVGAISVHKVNGGDEFKASVDEAICIGCGLCHSVCWVKALSMRRRREPIVPPPDFTEQQMRIAKEKGKAMG